MLRPIANPLPLGFLALAGGTLMLAGLQLGWIPRGEGHQVALVLLAFVVPLQLVSSVFGFLARDVVTGTGMGLLAGTWLAIALVTLTTPPGALSEALGTLLIASAALLLVPAGAASLAKVVPAAVIATTSVRFALTGVAQLGAGAAWADAAGIVGLVLCALAVYAGLALALEDARQAAWLPLRRRGGGAADGEVGVRRQI